jgi:hypothetical protein
LFFDVWTSFAPRNADTEAASKVADASISEFKIRATVLPPTALRASADLVLKTIHAGGERALLFELSRYLKVECDRGRRPRPGLHPEPVRLKAPTCERRGNDLVAVVFPAPLRRGARN